MQKHFEIEQGVPEIWGFKRLKMILVHETKKGKNTTVQCADPLKPLQEVTNDTKDTKTNILRAS